MIGSFRQSMTWLHTWAGLVFCWIIYFMFVTGTLGYLDLEIDRWMEEAPPASAPASFEQSVETAANYLETEAAGADTWFIRPAEGREAPHLSVFWSMPPSEDGEGGIVRGNKQLNVASGEPIPESRRETGGGQVLYRMHYLLHYFPGQSGYRLVGIITLLMFVGMITGIVVHKKIFKDFFTFRPGKGQRSWLDAHNLLSVSSLPFQLMITYSGLIFTVGLWMPMIALSSYGFDTKAAAALTNDLIGDVRIERGETEAPLFDPTRLIAVADEKWGPDQLSQVEVRYPGNENARIILHRDAGVLVRLGERMVFDGTNGEYLETIPGSKSGAVSFALAMLGLHEGVFAGPFLRWLYVLSGLLGTAMIATGAIHWTAKRRKKSAAQGTEGFGFKLVECLNIGTIVGLPIGIAGFFLANRLIPVDFEGRVDWEIHVMFLTWLACLIYPAVRGRHRAWRELSWLAALSYAAVPLVNAMTSDLHLINTIGEGDWVLAGFDLSCLAVAGVFAALAAYLGRGRKVAGADLPLEAGDAAAAGS